MRQNAPSASIDGRRLLASRIIRLISSAIWLFVFMLSAPAAAQERRIALIIGNAAYPTIGRLANPINDARLIRKTLEGLNFQVIYRENLDKAEMERAISAYSTLLTDAGPTGVGLFYYAGHAVQSNGENYLLPTDISMRRESDLRFSGVRLNDVLALMEAAPIGTRIVILDACRNSPFAAKFSNLRTSGLADIGLGSSEFFVAFAATAGNTADDGTGENGPFSAAVARRLATPNSEITNTFRLVRIDVSAATREKQVPEIRSTMRKQFFFAGGSAKAPQDLAVLTAPEQVTKVPTLADIVGKWCEAGRGRGISLEIGANTVTFASEGEKTRFDLQGVKASPGDATLTLGWQSKGADVSIEFGEFDVDGKSMTQLRGRRSGQEWKDYNLRFRRCAA